MLSMRSYPKRVGLALGKNNMTLLWDKLLKSGKQMSHLILHSEHILKFLLHHLKAILRRFFNPFPPPHPPGTSTIIESTGMISINWVSMRHTMNLHHFRSIVVVTSLVFMTGCIGYVSPYPDYSASMPAPYAVSPPVVMPYYRSYNYGIYPVVPFFRFGGRGWGHGGFGHYRHH